MNALVIAAHDGLMLDPAVPSVVTAAQLLVASSQGVVDVLLLGTPAADVLKQVATLAGVNTILHVPGIDLASHNAETFSRQVAASSAGYLWVLASHNLAARAAMPRAAALRDAAYLSDVIKVGDGEVERPAYAGAVSTRVQPAGQTFLTVRASAFVPASNDAKAANVLQADAVIPDMRTQRTGQDVTASHRPDLSRARIVVAGGRGVGSAENMVRVEALADHLGAAVGASRAAVDAGFASNSVQIGQTGKTIAPDIYIALGISGAIQHLAGIKDAKCIVAVNKEADAPIFQIADFGVVGDLFEALPALQSLGSAPHA